ncbi:hypothetical protein NDU88_004578 [Pleurodeles waltl]|uniref:Uncharacterized protein n=1 Tax=Pleurodeles waltl TaxID=8319 RepID=A0AAV7MWT4_PLEWA|nr:hypothetical protein NDU88_004578 [Pleurodeles waltl]
MPHQSLEARSGGTGTREKPGGKPGVSREQVCGVINNCEILLEDHSMGIPETAMSHFKSTKNAKAFTDLLLNNSLRFVIGHSKSNGATKATFNNDKSTLIIDYVIINMEAWSSILDVAVVNRVECDYNPLVLVMMVDDLGLGITTGWALVLHRREIVLSNCRRTIRWDGEKYRQGLPQLEPIIACHGQSIIDTPANNGPLILHVYDQMTKKQGALWSELVQTKPVGITRKGQPEFEGWLDKECAKAKREALVALKHRHDSLASEGKFKEYRIHYKYLLATKK